MRRAPHVPPPTPPDDGPTHWAVGAAGVRLSRREHARLERHNDPGRAVTVYSDDGTTNPLARVAIALFALTVLAVGGQIAGVRLGKIADAVATLSAVGVVVLAVATISCAHSALRQVRRTGFAQSGGGLAMAALLGTYALVVAAGALTLLGLADAGVRHGLVAYIGL